MQDELKIFVPRDKNVSCVHFVDCYERAKWCVEHQSNEGSYFEFYCEKHLKELKKKKKAR